MSAPWDIEWGSPIRISDVAEVPQRLDGRHTEYARLIAAAPALLAVAQELFSLDEPLIRDIYGSEFVSAARAAIAKATGSEA